VILLRYIHGRGSRMRIVLPILAVLTIAVSGPTWTSRDLIGKWKCNFTSHSTSHGGNSGVLYTSTPKVGITNTTAVVYGHTSVETDHWTYKATGPTTAVLTMTSPTRAAQLQAAAAEIHRPIPPAAPYIIHAYWQSHNHLVETGSDSVHYATYDCTRR
jgi:hypothetical protein